MAFIIVENFDIHESYSWVGSSNLPGWNSNRQKFLRARSGDMKIKMDLNDDDEDAIPYLESNVGLYSLETSLWQMKLISLY